MKKLMIGLVGALAMVAGAEVESGNIVGYKNSISGANYNFVAIPFTTIGNNTADIQQIKISDGGAMSIGWTEETFAIWEGAPSVVAGSEFTYYDPSIDPTGTATDYYWGDVSANRVDFSLVSGQGAVLTLAEGLEVSYAGEVANGAIECTSVSGYNFIGNTFADAIDIQAIKIDDGGIMSIGWTEETFAIWEDAPSVVADSEFTYYDPSIDPEGTATDYYWGDGSANRVTYSIEAGQSFVLSMGGDLSISVASPY